MASAPVRVAHVVHSLGWGGLEQVVLDLCAGFDRTRYDPLVVCLTETTPRAEQFAAQHVPVLVAPQRGLDLGLPRRLARLFRAEGVGLVHAHNFGRFFYAGPAARLAHLPSLYTEHSNTLPSERALWLTQRRLSRLAGRVAAVSPTVQHQLVATQGLPAGQVECLPNGIEVARYAAGDRAGSRSSLGLPADAFVVGHVGRLVPVKNQRLLLHAFAAVARKAPRAVLLLVGDGPERAPLEALTGELGLASAVRFLGLRDDIPTVLAGCDVFCLSSDSEGLPLAMLEALAAGLPVVATHGAGKDVVTPDLGRLSPTGDAPALAAHLLALEAAPEEVRQLGSRAAATARERYSVEAMVAAYTALYGQLTGTAGTR